MEFYYLKSHLMRSTRPMLAEATEYTQQKLVITRWFVKLPPCCLEHCCDSSRKNKVSFRFLTQPRFFPVYVGLEPEAKAYSSRHFKEHMHLVSTKLPRVSISYCKIHLFLYTTPMT